MKRIVFIYIDEKKFSFLSCTSYLNISISTMSIITFLATYWIYVTALVLAVWNVYLHVKANKAERRKNLQTSYIELTSIINNFQVDCLKLLQIEPEILNSGLNVSQDIDKVEEMLKNVDFVRERELLQKQSGLLESLKELTGKFEKSVDKSQLDQVREDIERKMIEVELLRENSEEESLKNNLFLDEARNIQQIAAKKVSSLHQSLHERPISLSKVVINLVNGLKSSSAWQLTASKSTIKLINCLESSTSKLRLKIFESVTTQSEKVQIETIFKSEEFRNTWNLSENIIKKMREELL